MGLRSCLVICITSFLLGALFFSLLKILLSQDSCIGTLFTNWIADSLTLWKQPVTDQHLWDAASYYAIVSKGPAWLYYILAATATAGAGNIFWSLCDGEAGNLMFDGGSIFLYMTALVMYTYSVVPSAYKHVTITLVFFWELTIWIDIVNNFASLPVHDIGASVPSKLTTYTLDLASKNLICSVALTGVMVFQAGRHWAEKSDDEPTVYETKKEKAS